MEKIIIIILIIVLGTLVGSNFVKKIREVRTDNTFIVHSAGRDYTIDKNSISYTNDNGEVVVSKFSSKHITSLSLSLLIQEDYHNLCLKLCNNVTTPTE